MTGQIFKAMLWLCLLALLVACSTGPATEGPASTRSAGTTHAASSQDPTTRDSTGDSPYDAEPFFPELTKAPGTPLVPGGGEFFLDDHGCLHVDDVGAKTDLGYVPLWPPQYELDTGKDGIRVLDGKGRTVARVGEEVVIGGGGIDRKTLEEYGFLDERTMRELFERCSGPDYWIIDPGSVHLSSAGRSSPRPASTATNDRPAEVTSSAPGVFFPRQKASVYSYLMALWRGELVLDGEGCLRVRDEYGALVPVWPPGFGVEASGGEVRVLNKRGRVVARVGDEIEIGGGEAPPAERLVGVNERTKRELRERCPGQYWYASPSVDVIRQG